MKAAIYEEFQKPPTIENVPDAKATATGVVLEVKACGICRSDWHGWMGNDADIRLPHIPGHELAGVIVETGRDVKNRQKGDRVTVPFVGGCGKCPQCLAGHQQVCDFQFQPGFTAWGAFAEFVAIDYADTNLVRLPDEIDFVTAASLGCRFMTAFRAVAHQSRLAGGEWLAVHGAGGVGLSAVMIASALGARVVAVDISDEKLALARSVGAEFVINAQKTADVVETVREITGGGAHISLDALGHPVTCFNSISNLRKRGRHIQVGIMEAEHRNPSIPMAPVVANELEILGSHGMPAHQYPAMLAMIAAGALEPQKLIGKTIPLADSVTELINMNNFAGTGVTVIDRF